MQNFFFTNKFPFAKFLLFFSLLNNFRPDFAFAANQALVRFDVPEINQRICTLQGISDQGPEEFLTAILINNSWLLSVAHFSFDPKRIYAKCKGLATKKLLVQRSFKTPDSYTGFNFSPKNFSEWSKNDVGLFQLKEKLSVEVSTDIRLTKLESPSSAFSNQCVLVGSSSETLGSIDDGSAKSFRLIRDQTYLNTATNAHSYMIYSGPLQFFGGDSGGPVLCLNSGIWEIVSLLQYSGTIAQGPVVSNLIGFIHIDRSLQMFIEQNLN